jgi:hypothetical protein
VIINLKEVPKWQYRREKHQKQEEIKEEIIYGSLLLPPSLNASVAANTSALTDFAPLVEPTTDVKL